jgi:hypothetical protein
MFVSVGCPVYAHTRVCAAGLRAAAVSVSDMVAGVPLARAAEPSDVGLTRFPRGVSGRTTITHCAGCADVRLELDGEPFRPPARAGLFTAHVLRRARLLLHESRMPEGELDVHTRLYGSDMSEDAVWLTRCVILAAREVDR